MSASIDPQTGYTALMQDGVNAVLFNSNGIYQGSPQVPVRQTVLQSLVDTSGFPSFLAATFASLVVTTQNVSTGLSAFVATASQGSNVQGAINVIGQSTTNLTWPACTANQTNYLPVLVANTGILTPQIPVILVPIYQWGGTPAVTSGQYTFNIQQMTMYLGNGATAPAVNHVIVGEVVAGASTITSTIAYALMGRYDSGYTATLPTAATYTSKNHNIGADTCNGLFLAKNTTTDLGYAVGEIVAITPQATNAVQNPTITRTTIGIQSGSGGGGWSIVARTGGAMTAITSANWSYKFIANRSW